MCVCVCVCVRVRANEKINNMLTLSNKMVTMIWISVRKCSEY